MQKNWNNCGGHFQKQDFLWNLVIFICSKVVKSYPRKKSCKNQTFHPILTIKYSIPTKMTMASSNKLSKLIFSHFLKVCFFDIKCWVRNVKNPFFSKSQKKLFQSICFTKTHFMNLFRMLFMFKAETLPILRKVEKTPFLLQKNHHFCCSFWQNSNFWDKKYSPNLHNWDPKTVYFHPFLINIPQFLNQNRVIESFLPKNVFFPCFSTFFPL